MNKDFKKCPICVTGQLQQTYVYLDNQTLKAYGCNKCNYSFWEPQIDTKTYTISTTGTAPEIKLQREIGQVVLEREELLQHLNMVQVSISHLLQDGDIDPEKETAITTLKNVLSETEQLQKKYGRTTKWYNCAKCDALYEDQECTCVEHTEECGWHKDWSSCSCHAFTIQNLKFNVKNQSDLLKRVKEHFYDYSCSRGGEHYKVMKEIEDVLKKTDK